MSEQMEVPTPEVTRGEFVFKKEGGAIEVSTPHVDLTSERDPFRFAVTLEKVPTPVEYGTAIENITIDKESPKLQEMIKQAQTLRDIPERERPRRILQLLRSNVHYAYTDVLEEVAKTDPELAKWVAENTGIDSSSAKPITLSEITDKGYAVCRHLSAAMLVLAKEAGMEGAYLTYSSPVFAKEKPNPKYLARNVVRRDTNQPLFKMGDVGEPIWGGHAWVELRTSDGEWIPVDPSTQLVGDTPEGLETFRDANYIALVSQSLEIEGFPGDVGHLGNQDLWFLPTEKTHTGILEVNSKPRQKPIRITLGKKVEKPEDTEQWPKPTQYKGPLNFNFSSVATSNGLNVGVLDVKTA